MIKKFYLKTYPSDELGSEIADSATWFGLMVTLAERKNVYDYLGVGDSIIRERVFVKLCEILKCDYSEVYDLWLSSSKVA